VADLPITFRIPVADDVQKVVQTWRFNHERFGCQVMPMWKDARFKHMEEHLAKILQLATMERITICCSKDDKDLIIGWMCYEPSTVFAPHESHKVYPIVHYLYTTDGFRHQGIATQMLKHADVLGHERIWVTHYNYRIKRLLQKIRQKWYYDPYLIDEILGGTS